MSSGKVSAASSGEETLTKENDAKDGESTIPDEFIIEGISYTPCTSMCWASIIRPMLPPKDEYAPVEKFVYNAICYRSVTDRAQMEPSTQKAAGLGYKAILDLLRKRDDPIMLRKVLLALRTSGEGMAMGKIISDSKRHSNLLHLIFKSDPFSLSDEANTKSNVATDAAVTSHDYSLADAYLNLIVALVSANSVFLTPALNMLWRLMTDTDAITPEDRQLVLHMDETKSEDQIESITEQQFQRNLRLHGALSKILHLVPKGNTELFPVIASAFPFKLSPLEKQACYVKQCFIVLNYVPIIRRNILELCIDKCLEIDVEIRIAQDGNVKIEEAKNEDDDDDDDNAPFKMDEDSDEKKVVKEEEKQLKEKYMAEKNNADQVDEFAEKVSCFCIRSRWMHFLASNTMFSYSKIQLS